MSHQVTRARINAVLAQERENNPLTWWYLSFADHTGFLGAVILRAHGMADACSQAYERAINPGGEVQGVGAPPCFSPPEAFCNRLLTREEVKDMDKAILGARSTA